MMSEKFLYKYSEIQPQKMCIYRGIFPSGEIKYFQQMLKGCITTILFEYDFDGRLSLILAPLVDPLYWNKLTKNEFTDTYLKWGRKFKDYEEDFCENFEPLPGYLKELDKKKK